MFRFDNWWIISEIFRYSASSCQVDNPGFSSECNEPNKCLHFIHQNPSLQIEM